MIGEFIKEYTDWILSPAFIIGFVSASIVTDLYVYPDNHTKALVEFLWNCSEFFAIVILISFFGKAPKDNDD